ncbi:MAG: hypothetical protein HY744_33175 [Deltaproteobacteria bacterium]|nr:hypothetical protein [Deltaproteobacteria bacterium]
MKTTTLRFWHLLAAAPAVLILTGAKGEGCGGEVIVEPPPEPTCPAGTHIETLCDDEPTPLSGSGPADKSDDDQVTMSCHDECVADNQCPDGYIAQETCAVSSPVYCEDSLCDCPENSDCECPPSYCEPSEEQCWTECVPACPQGSHAELVCGGPVPEPVSDSKCGSGSGEKGGCDEEPPAPPPGDDCTMQCVPDNVCPPGYQEVGVCNACEYGSDYCDDTCWTECVPVDPTCPPECIEQVVCEDCAEGEDCGGCYSTCECASPSEPPSGPQAS